MNTRTQLGKIYYSYPFIFDQSVLQPEYVFNDIVTVDHSMESPTGGSNHEMICLCASIITMPDFLNKYIVTLKEYHLTTAS